MTRPTDAHYGNDSPTAIRCSLLDELEAKILDRRAIECECYPEAVEAIDDVLTLIRETRKGIG